MVSDALKAIPLAKLGVGRSGGDFRIGSGRPGALHQAAARGGQKKSPTSSAMKPGSRFPFDLNDVIWDYQRMGGGSEEEGFALETEVGLFANETRGRFRRWSPSRRAGIGVDIVQLTPLVLYNFLLFDQVGALPTAEEYDPENPPESVVVISLGTDATDLVITNGFRVWQRSVPLGGNHFTRALTKELKLTFAKAEHLKRNATATADPKAVFQAMRPIFRRPADRTATLAQLFLEPRPGGADRADHRAGQCH